MSLNNEPQSLNQHISTIVSAQYRLNLVYPPEISEAQSYGSMHILDLGFLSVYCIGWDLEDFLLSGFTGVSGQAASKPARHLRSALGQVVNFFYTMELARTSLEVKRKVIARFENERIAGRTRQSFMVVRSASVCKIIR